MRSCVHSVSLPRLPILEVFRRARQNGFRGVEINAETLPWAEPHVTPETSAARRESIVQTARELGLFVPALGAHVPMIDADPEKRKAALDFVLGCLELGRDLGTSVVHVLSGPLPANSTTDEAWRWFAEAVTAAASRAAEVNVTFAIEAIAGHMFCSTDDYHRLRVDLPGVPFHVNFDPSHLIVQGENPMRVVDELADSIAHVHLKDGAGRFPRFTFPPLGRGEVDFPGLINGLRRAGYAGSMSVEYEAQVYGFKLSDDEILSTGRDFLSALHVE